MSEPSERDREMAREARNNSMRLAMIREGDPSSPIADAIAAARAEERESCAEVAHAIGMRHATDGFVKAKSRTGRDKANAGSRCALEIEDALRKRGQS
jgi:hypothetical protein